MNNRRRHRGFIFVFGWRTISTRESSPVIAPCPHCKKEDARLQGRVRRRWFTLMFIPVFPLVPAANGHRITRCRECKTDFDMPVEQLVRKVDAINAASFADTIAVYNDLRENPTDGKIMLKLLRMYDELQELNEAEIAARHFPKAMAADPCGVLLAAMRGG